MNVKQSPRDQRDESHIWGRAAREAAERQPLGFRTIDEAHANLILHPPPEGGQSYFHVSAALIRQRTSISNLELLQGIQDVRTAMRETQARMDELASTKDPDVPAWCAKYRAHRALLGELSALEGELRWRHETGYRTRGAGAGLTLQNSPEASSSRLPHPDPQGPTIFDPFEDQ